MGEWESRSGAPIHPVSHSPIPYREKDKAMPVITGGQIAEGAFYRSFFNAGAPANGAAGTGAGHAQPGSLCIDITNGKVYVNTGTKPSPTWVELVRQDGAIPDGPSVATKADANVIGGLPVLHRIDVPAGGTRQRRRPPTPQTRRAGGRPGEEPHTGRPAP